MLFARSAKKWLHSFYLQHRQTLLLFHSLYSSLREQSVWCLQKHCLFQVEQVALYQPAVRFISAPPIKAFTSPPLKFFERINLFTLPNTAFISMYSASIVCFFGYRRCTVVNDLVPEVITIIFVIMPVPFPVPPVFSIGHMRVRP